MKTKVISLVYLFFIGTSMVFAQTKTEKFEVKGSCGMCKDRIEETAKSMDGVTAANWNQRTNMLKVSFDESKTSLQKLQMAIANVGHDTPMYKAKDEVYNALPQCCKYDRTEMKKKETKSKKIK